MTITTSHGTSDPFNIVVRSHAPGLFRPEPYCPVPNSANPNTGQPEGVQLDAIGLGPVDRERRTVTTPAVTVGGQSAEVLESLANGFVYSVRFRLPRGLPDGRAHSVVLTIGGETSNSAPLFVGATNRLATFGGWPGTVGVASIITVAGCAAPLASATLGADGAGLPVRLGGTSVKVRDSLGVERIALLYYVSPGQVNYVLPVGTPAGEAIAIISTPNGDVSTAPMQVQRVAPGLFALPGPENRPAPAALVVRLRNGVQTIEPVARDASGEIVPIDMGPESDQLSLVLFGTGLRFGTKVSVGICELSECSVGYGGLELPLEYAGLQPEFPGLDQVNVRLPRSLATGQPLEYVLTVGVDGQGPNRLYSTPLRLRVK